MKLRLILIILLVCFTTFFLFPQANKSWDRFPEVEEFLEEWEIYLEVWGITTYNGYIRLHFEDFESEDWFDVNENIVYLMLAFETVLDWDEFSFEDLDINGLTYSWFIEYDYNNVYNEETNEVWDIHFDREWLEEFFDIRRERKKIAMIDDLLDEIVEEWEEQFEEQKYIKGPSRNSPIGKVPQLTWERDPPPAPRKD